MHELESKEGEMKNLIKSFIFFTIAAIFFGSSIIDSYAMELCSEGLDCTERCSILTDYKYNDTPLDDVEFRVYQVTALNEDYEHELLEKFEDFDIDFDQLTDNSYWIQLINNLENYINYEMLQPDRIFLTDDTGQYNLEDLDVGMYLIQAEVLEKNNQLLYSEPILIIVGNYDDSNEEWIYDYTIEPKISVMSLEMYNLTVTKVWENTNSALLIPTEIQVELHCNGEVYDVITLSETNGWTYTWYDMDPLQSWGVNELTEVEDFEVDYKIDIQEFTITNTYCGTSDEELPQTGTSAYLITIFSGIGLVFLLLGVLLKYGIRYKDNDKTKME